MLYLSNPNQSVHDGSVTAPGLAFAGLELAAIAWFYRTLTFH